MTYLFRGTIEALSVEGAGGATAPIVFETSNHDDLIELVSKVRALSVVA